ncbi:MAG: hydroxymethylglutaryl-CoA lyase [Acidimicrobiia bacterium]|nr:hydroxymethylglutaryl-CoA lyase [Acidimicrobiia bacterium]MBT8193671.1 hydroxymethylglutaryl-CoA lyase [Acidimicrobiia bacterium]MBT8247582.1 hydroxymethylglutaryl-CoA lyase [Acidimicrobiia bacterium]NNF87881.1 hydroxymethylglutaryl-CoA lyase [Acidimicrobiia bacterium]NNJ46257.1 hydroxymethylglutaryl-CoA lyase [Acidimicrobiia bacterium]
MIQIVEVGPRDGLQNESVVLETDQKVALIERLVQAGATRIEIVSFAHPGRVPQMADAEAVAAAFAGREDFSRIGLVMNERGWQRAQEVELDEVNIPVGATDGFNQANVAASPNETIEFVADVVGQSEIPVTGTVSVAFGCPYDGEVNEETVVEIAGRLAEAGCAEIAIADTIGVADPWTVRSRLASVRAATGDVPLRVHFHDTRNTGIANTFAAIESGVEIVDASAGGIGGCPFAPNATGNIATDDLVFTLHRAGFVTGMDLDRLIETARWVGEVLAIDPPSALLRAGDFRPG